MTKEEALRKVIKYCQDDFDMRLSEIRDSFEYKLVEHIFLDFEAEIANLKLKYDEKSLKEKEALVDTSCIEVKALK